MARDRMRPPLAALEAQLALRVQVAGERIERVSIGGFRPVQAAGILEGRPVEAALAALPHMYQLCGTAQSVAGLRAVEAGFGCGPGPSGCAARSLLVDAEALDQLLWRILLDWPRCIGAPGDVGALKGLRRRLAGLGPRLFAEADWHRAGGVSVKADPAALSALVEDLAADVDAVLFGGAPCGDVLAGRAGFEAWVAAAASATAAALGWVATNGLRDFGNGGTQPLHELDAERVAGRMARDDAWEYCGRPYQGGEVPQTGALARLGDAPLLRELAGVHASGLWTQLAARLVEVASRIAALREGLGGLEPAEMPELPPLSDGSGLGSVDTARGRLFHWVDVRAGKIARYRTLAPTEWNFHPSGPLVQALRGTFVRDGVSARRALELFVTAIDPCVGYRLDVSEA